METHTDVVNTEDIIHTDLFGCVKWFNTKLGYGFITNLDTNDEDVFVHHSSILSDSETFRYLIQGEYVQFTLARTTLGPHTTHAIKVTGIRGGKLLCDAHKYNYTYTSNINRSTTGSRGYPCSSDAPRATGYSGPTVEEHMSSAYNGYKQVRQSRPVIYRHPQGPPDVDTSAYEKPYRVPRSASQK